MTQTKYQFNYSQDIVNLQIKYSLFKRVSNILFSVTFENGFKDGLMTKAIELLVERNDCLRLVCEKGKGGNVQYFRDEYKIKEIPSVTFSTYGQIDKFIKKFRKGAINVFKGETFKPVLATGPSGERTVYIKISHFVADTYGIGVLVNDLQQIYNSLEKGEALPPAPAQFEEILKKDSQYRANDDALEKDKAFFKDYYEVQHPQMPMYCGIHGNESDRWFKFKKKGTRALPYLFVKCDTRGYRFVIPSTITERVEELCAKHQLSMNTFFFYTCAIACSLRNDKYPYQIPLELMNCRGTVADRKAAGTKVQSLGVYTNVDYTKSFIDNAMALYNEQAELYRHTKLSYLEVEAIQHKLWGHPMTTQLTNFCFSFIPVSFPKGINFSLHSNGKGALATYMALMLNIDTKEVYAMYDVQTKMCSTEQMMEFQNTYIKVIEAVLKFPESPLNELF